MKKLWQKFKLYLHDNIINEQDCLIFWLPFFFAFGIALYFCLPFEPSVWLSLAVFELWLLAFYFLRFRNLYLLFIAGLFILGGFLNIQAHTLYHAKHIETFSVPTPTYLRGQIIDISASPKGKTRLLLNNAADFDKPLKGKFRITASPLPDDIAIGKCVETVATVFPRKPLPILNGYRTDRNYFYENLSAIGYTNSETFIIDCPKNQNGQSFKSYLNTLRQKIIRYIGTVLPPAESGVANAVLLGEKTLVPRQIIDNYRNSGLAHFLSVSGLHLGAIAGLVFFAVRFLLALFPWLALHWNIKKIAAVVAIIFSAFYLLISGMAIPAERAFIMTTVVLIGVIFNRQAISLRMVSFAALVVLILSPQALISVSFQMSFAAVYALVAFYEHCKFRPTAQRGILRKIFFYLSGIVVCDFVASLATAPFSLYHFQRLAIYTSLGNLLAGPLIGLYLLPLMLLCLITLPLNLAFYPLKALGFGLNILNHITDFVAHLPHSVWYNNALPFWGFMLIICGGFWLCVWKRPWRKFGLVPIIIGILPMFIPTPRPDIVFTPYGANIAIRNSSKNLVMVKSKKDAWLKQIWQENLHLVPTSKPQNISGLTCNDTQCTYKDIFSYDTAGNIWLKQKPIDNSAGGYIYLKSQPYWQPLWNNKHRRIWSN